MIYYIGEDDVTYEITEDSPLPGGSQGYMDGKLHLICPLDYNEIKGSWSVLKKERLNERIRSKT